MNNELKVAYILSDKNLIVRCMGMVGTLLEGTDKFTKAMEFIENNDMDSLARLVIPSIDFAIYSHLELKIIKGKLLRFGVEVPKEIADVIFSLKDKKLPYNHLLKFWDKLSQNPEKSSIEQLYGFLSRHEVPITHDGYFMAYKSVKKLEDGTMVAFHDNSTIYEIDKKTIMARNDVVCDPLKGCGPGLHVGSYEYADEMYSREDKRVILECIIDPKDVVSVPVDFNCSKIRTCCILPICICSGKAQSIIYNKPVEPNYQDNIADTDVYIVDEHITEVKIGNYIYKSKCVSNFKQMDDFVTVNEYSYKKVKKSRIPLFFKRLGIMDLYRQEIENKKYNYIACDKTGIYVEYIRKN